MPTAQLERMGNYLLRKRVGRGRLGKVYEAIHCTTNQRVAVKVLSNKLANDHCCVGCFERNVNAAKELRHPNIVRIKDIGEYEGRYYCTMEFVESQNLAEYLREHGGLAAHDALRLFEQAADALKHAWRKKVVHGHLTPNNLLITPDGQLKICDFGTAEAHSDVNKNETEEGFDPCELDPRVDVRALAALLYGTLIGRPLALPDGKSIKFSNTQLSALPGPVQSLLQKMIDERFDPADLLDAVRETIARQIDWDSKQAGQWTSKDENPIREIYLYMALGFGILAGVIGMIGFGLFRSDGKESSGAQAITESVDAPSEGELQSVQKSLPSLIQQHSFTTAFARLSELHSKFGQHPESKAAIVASASEVIRAADAKCREVEKQALNASTPEEAASLARSLAGENELEFVRRKAHRLLLNLYLKWHGKSPSEIQITERELPDALVMLLRKRDYETARTLCMMAMAKSEASIPNMELLRWVDWLTDAVEFWRNVEEGARRALGHQATFHFTEEANIQALKGRLESLDGHSLKIQSVDGTRSDIQLRRLTIDDALRLAATELDTTEASFQRRVGMVLLLDLKREQASDWLRQAADADHDHTALEEVENRSSLISRTIEASNDEVLLAVMPETLEALTIHGLARY